jgi:hypothetical protein
MRPKISDRSDFFLQQWERNWPPNKINLKHVVYWKHEVFCKQMYNFVFQRTVKKHPDSNNIKHIFLSFSITRNRYIYNDLLMGIFDISK